ncbi:helix-turn-helix domain-containing protein [Consotaella salsifontis]|uniref:helix-turn-helix domain-containing protein n=1 Tax=Consotaella salsifontis TaxID=1365950 RepID=UPI00099AD730
MSPDDFRSWRERLNLTQAQAAMALGLALTKDGTTSDAVRHYERGSRAIPETVAKLCRYIERYGVLD